MNLGPVIEGWQHLRLVSDAQYISLGKTMWRLSYTSVPCTASSFQPKVALEWVSSPLGLIDKPAGSLGLRRLSAAFGSSSRASGSQVPVSQDRSREGWHLRGRPGAGLSSGPPHLWLPFPVRSSFPCSQFRGWRQGGEGRNWPSSSVMAVAIMSFQPWDSSGPQLWRLEFLCASLRHGPKHGML